LFSVTGVYPGPDQALQHPYIVNGLVPPKVLFAVKDYITRAFFENDKFSFFEQFGASILSPFQFALLWMTASGLFTVPGCMILCLLCQVCLVMGLRTVHLFAILFGEGDWSVYF